MTCAVVFVGPLPFGYSSQRREGQLVCVLGKTKETHMQHGGKMLRTYVCVYVMVSMCSSRHVYSMLFISAHVLYYVINVTCVHVVYYT